MKAIYDSGIPIDFKGSMVLRACLLEVGYCDDIRHTLDIDANWYSQKPPTADQMTSSLQNVFDLHNIDLIVNIYRMYDDGKSAGFELTDKYTNEVLFSMDIDVNRPITPTKIYEIGDIKFRGVTASQMLADKITTISTDKVFRRIKDVVDLYYFSKVIDFNKEEIINAIKISNKVLEDFDGFLNKFYDLKHAYDKFRFTGNINKLSFIEIYNTVKTYIKDIIPKNK